MPRISAELLTIATKWVRCQRVVTGELWRCWLVAWISITFLVPSNVAEAHLFAHFPPMPQNTPCPGTAPPVSGSGGGGGGGPAPMPSANSGGGMINPGSGNGGGQGCTTGTCGSPNGGGNGGGDGNCSCTLDPPPGTATPTVVTGSPVFLHMGTVYESVSDFRLPGPGLSVSIGRNRFAGDAQSPGQTHVGYYWIGDPVEIFLYQPSSTNVVLVTPGGVRRDFTPVGGGSSYTAPRDSYLVLTPDAANQQFILTDQAKNTRWIFNDFTVTNTLLRGTLKEQTTLQLTSQGLSGFVYSYNTDGTLNQITTPSGQDYSIIYTWVNNLVKKIQIKDASANLLAQIDYTFYQDVTGGVSTDLGGTDNLVQVKVSRKATKDASGTLSIVRYTQYRYTSDRRYVKAIYEHDAIMRMVGTLSGVTTPENLLTRADTYGTPAVKEFASRSFTYYAANASTASITTPFATNENLNSTYGGSEVAEANYVKTETIGGCGGCGGSNSITKSYFYTGLSNSSADQNGVTRIIVEDTTDSAGNPMYRTVYGTQGDVGDGASGGRMLRRAFIQSPISSPTYWCESWTFATSTGSTTLPYRLAEQRYPSAHTTVTTASSLRNFLNPYNGSSWANDSATLNTSTGKIEVHSYNSAGFRTDSKVKNGSSGTAYYVSAADYGDGTNATLLMATYDYPTQTTTRSSGIQTSYSYTFYDSSTHQQIKTKTTTLPAVPTTQNGSNVATTTSEYYDNIGRLRWTQDGEGYVNYYAYHPVMGTLAYTAVDVDPSSVSSDISSGSSGNWDAWTVGGANSNKPTRSGSLPTPLALATKKYFDSLGRPTRTTDRGGANHYTTYENLRTIRFPYWDSTNSKSLLPIKISKLNTSAQQSEDISVKASYTSISTSSGAPTGFSTDPGQSDYVGWTRYTYNSPAGWLTYTDRYATIPSSGTGTLGSDFYRSVTQYDTLGRKQYDVQVIRGSASSNRVEQVTKYTYDILDRVIQVDQGVSGDTAANSQDMTDNYNNYPALVTVSKTEYDAGGVGDGFVTKTKQYFGTGTNDFTGTNYKRTYRGHLRGVEPFYMSGSTETPIGPYPVTDVDWKGRTTTQALYDIAPTWSSVLTGDGYSSYASSTSTNRRTQEDILYDNLGRIYQAKEFEISASSGAGSNYISNKSYYDRNGRLVATGAAYASGTEIAYDGAGRQYQTRTVVALQSTPYSSGAFNYSAPAPNPSLGSISGGDAGVLTLSHQVLDADGNTLETDTFEANHDDLMGGSVGVDLTNNDDYVRRTVFHWYDAADRLTTTADYGSGDTASGAGQWKYATLPSRPGSAPTTSSNTALVTTFTHNSDSGLRELEVDPAGTLTKIFYDRLGRITYFAQNYDNFNASSESGTGDSTDPSKDKITKKIYDGPGRLKQLVAMDPNADGSLSDNQVTTYLYEDSVNATRKTNEIYPDSTDTTSSGTNQIKLAYNVDGRRTQRIDQRGTVLTFTYTNSRLMAIQSATTLGTGVDGTIQSIAYTYDNLNRKQNITSYSSTGGTGTVVNDVQFVYNDMGQLTTTYQSHSGTVNTSISPNVQYTYDTTVTSNVFSAQHRGQTIVYPNGRAIYYDFGTTGSAYNALSKTRTIYDTSASGTALATYDWNGAGSRLAVATLPEPSLKLDLFQGTSGTYAGLDRFGRVIDQYWKGFGATADADRIHYAYDYAGSRTYRDIDSSIYATNDKDQTYTFDGLHRLGTVQQGTLSGTSVSGTPTIEEDWTLDPVGNWTNYITKAGGTTTLNQTRTANGANEISGISASVGLTWATPAYDAAGNMTTIPEPASLTTGYTATYDAWNRLVKLVDASTSQTVQENQYDGRKFRTVIKSYNSGTLTETRHAYFDDNWRCVEERVGTSTSTDRQFIWGSQYIDDLILRDRDTDANGSLDERLYATQDANWNVTAVSDATGAVKERYLYSGYGTPTFLTSSFGNRSISSYAWETLFCGYRYDSLSGMYLVRNRVYHPTLGTWIRRDPAGYIDDASLYSASFVPHTIDPFGLQANPWDGGPRRPPTPAPPRPTNNHPPTDGTIPGSDPYDGPPDTPYTGRTCRITVRCFGVPEWSPIRPGSHCGLIVRTDDGAISIDGTGGNENNFDWDDPPYVSPATIPGGTGNPVRRDPGDCECLRAQVARWNALAIPRTNTGMNSNWSLRCLLGRCNMTINWGAFGEPVGYNAQCCAQWEQSPSMMCPGGTCVRYERCPCP